MRVGGGEAIHLLSSRERFSVDVELDEGGWSGRRDVLDDEENNEGKRSGRTGTGRLKVRSMSWYCSRQSRSSFYPRVKG